MHPVRPLFVSTYPPEECGLATFTKDSADAVDLVSPEPVSTVTAIQKTRGLRYDDRVVHVIDDEHSDAYCQAAEVANDGPCDVVSVQHNCGIYPGESGLGVLDFVRRCRKPIVTTLHALQSDPHPVPRDVIRRLAANSRNIVVMTRIARQLLVDVYNVPWNNVQVIPHGVPELPFVPHNLQKARLGLGGRQVLCTFGLINRSKGLESMIKAMPKIVASCPQALYMIVGVTHPQLKRQEGEAYRESLEDMAEELGIGRHVRFVNRFLSLAELLQHLQACDVFVTPFSAKDQIASGTLAYALAAGLAVVSTPYLYAKEVLANGRGLLVPFDHSSGLANATVRFLTRTAFRTETRRSAYEYARPMTWPNVGRRYLDLFGSCCANGRRASRASVSQSNSSTE